MFQIIRRITQEISQGIGLLYGTIILMPISIIQLMLATPRLFLNTSIDNRFAMIIFFSLLLHAQ